MNKEESEEHYREGINQITCEILNEFAKRKELRIQKFRNHEKIFMNNNEKKHKKRKYFHKSEN